MPCLCQREFAWSKLIHRSVSPILKETYLHLIILTHFLPWTGIPRSYGSVPTPHEWGIHVSISTFGFGVAMCKSNGSWGSRWGRLLLIHYTFGVRLIEAKSALFFRDGEVKIYHQRSQRTYLGRGKHSCKICLVGIVLVLIHFKFNPFPACSKGVAWSVSYSPIEHHMAFRQFIIHAFSQSVTWSKVIRLNFPG